MVDFGVVNHAAYGSAARCRCECRESKAGVNTNRAGWISRVGFNAEQIELVDKWIATNDPAIDRSELGLKVKK